MLSGGDILDEKYEVIKILGKGGMGTVYLCKNIRFGNFWAIKEVIQDIKNIDILTEANILRDLNHPGIRKIVDIFYKNSNLYMVQDYVEGETLKEYVKKNGRVQTEKICQITSDLCDIIGYLHNQNPAILYRDIKPSNIMITPNGKVVLIDFGISKVYKSDTEQDTVCAGSNGYAAPEQYGLGKCCKQTDIYGIGMLLYFMLKGKSPSTGVEPLLDENYEHNIDDNFRIIIQKCVKIDIKDRYSSVEALKKDILDVLKREKYEKTAILNESNISTNALIKKVKTKIKNKYKIKKASSAVLCFIIAILAGIYIFNLNKKENVDIDTADRLEIMSPIVGSQRLEEEPNKEPIIVPVKVNTIGLTEDSIMNEKTSPVYKGKEKKKSKHSKEN